MVNVKPVSLWINAKMVASEAANALRRSVPGMEIKQGDMTAPEPLEQITTTLARCADELADYPDTAEYVQQYREIAYRWSSKGRPKTDEEWQVDYKVLAAVESEMFRRMVKEHKAQEGPSAAPEST